MRPPWRSFPVSPRPRLLPMCGVPASKPGQFLANSEEFRFGMIKCPLKFYRRPPGGFAKNMSAKDEHGLLGRCILDL
jgi:hypothetical protein